MPETLAATSPIPSAPFIPPGGEQAARVTIGPGPDLQLASMQFSPASHAAVQTALMAAYGVEAPRDRTNGWSVHRRGRLTSWTGCDG